MAEGRQVRPGVLRKIMAHRAPTINACFSKEGRISIGADSVWERTLVVPTVIYFAPLLRAHVLRLWRDCALRLGTCIFGRHRIVDRSSITPLYNIIGVALTARQGYGNERCCDTKWGI